MDAPSADRLAALAVEHAGKSSLRLALGCRLDDEQRMLVQQVLVTTSLKTHRAIPIADDLRSAMLGRQARQFLR